MYYNLICILYALLCGQKFYSCKKWVLHTTNDCKELRRQIQSAIEQGRLILGQFVMKVDTRPFPGINMVEGHRDAGERSVRR
jgi:hypothetical protein